MKEKQENGKDGARVDYADLRLNSRIPPKVAKVKIIKHCIAALQG
jgi:hypothetical protein